MRRVFILLSIIIINFLIISCMDNKEDNKKNVVIENKQLKLILRKDGTAESLIFKPTGEGCLIEGKQFPISSITQERPYNNEIKLAYPNKEMTFKANSISREGDQLIVGFEIIPYEAIINLEITPHYIRFGLEDFIVEEDDYKMINITEPPVSEMCFLQLPVRDRGHFGDWLNVSWGGEVAVNVLGTDHYARIDSEEGEGYHLLKAGVDRDIEMKGVGAALITCSSDQLLDHIDQVEKDYNLPRGAKSRRNNKYNLSYYFSGNVNPDNVDDHLKYAKMGGFRTFMIYHTAFTEGKTGNYHWRRSKFPNGKEDLREMLDTIKDEGMIPGFHFLHSHISRESKYVTPVPDHRLNLRKIFTLAAPLEKNDTMIYVEQNPRNCTMADNRRLLKVGKEFISYKGYTTTRPYKFTGCKRGVDETAEVSKQKGYMFGLLDVTEFFNGRNIHIDQNSNLQDEIAKKLANIYDAGFRFCYFDGSEAVNSPFWFNVSRAQWRVYKQLKPEPLFAEGAAKTHFSWHMLSRGNAFDVFRPEKMKEAVREHPGAEAPRMRDNFTHINFGWIGYWVPNENTVGTQPDMLEYVTSRAAGWDCPVNLQANLREFEAHARTPDNLEVFKRWEDVRAQDWLSEEQKQMLRNFDQEHILLINEQQEFELLPYKRIRNVANGSRKIRAFIFLRNGDLYAVYWHISRNKKIKLPISPQNITLLEGMGKEISIPDGDKEAYVTLPAGRRRFIKTSETKRELITAFEKAKILP